MELRRVAEAVVRSHTTPLMTFLVPSNTTRWAAGAQRSCQQVGNKSIARQFGTSNHRNANAPRISVTTTTPSPSEQASSIPSTEAPAEPSFQERASIEELSRNMWAAAPRTPRSFKEVMEEQEKRFNGGASSSDLLAAINKRRSGTSDGIDISKMITPFGEQGQGDSDMMSASLKNFTIHTTPRKPLILNASTGRSITVATGNIDVSRGFRMLEQSCARNRVKNNFMQQRFHERGGLKRKRLRRERWRRKFMEGFRSTVDRVKALRKQGW